MRVLSSLSCIVVVALLGCSPSAESLPFESAFAQGLIAWEPVSNVEVTTTQGSSKSVQSVNFVTKIKYDASGRGSPDTTGQTSYKWSDREAVFGSGAVIRVTKATKTRDGEISSGAEWTWTGDAWKAKGK